MPNSVNELITVIIPAYNVEKYIAECLKTITAQTYQNLEIIVIDDGSKDKTGTIVKSIANNDQRIVYIHQNNQGVSVARNNGIDLAKGKYLVFVDADDTIKSKMIEKLYRALQEDNSDISQCNYLNSLHHIPFFNTYLKRSTYNKQEILTKIIENNTIQNFSWARLYKKETFNNVSFNVGQRFEDIRTIFKAFENANLVSTIPYYGYKYNIRGGSYTNKMNVDKIIEMKSAFDYQKDYIISRYNITPSTWNNFMCSFMGLRSLLKHRDNEGYQKACNQLFNSPFKVNAVYTGVYNIMYHLVKTKYKKTHSK